MNNMSQIMKQAKAMQDKIEFQSTGVAPAAAGSCGCGLLWLEALAAGGPCCYHPSPNKTTTQLFLKLGLLLYIPLIHNLVGVRHRL